jgi:hypothetical protein
MKRGGGLFFDKQGKEELFRFIRHSHSTFITQGAYGYTFKLTLRGGYESKYRKMTYNHYGERVDSILIKIGYVKADDSTKLEKTSINMHQHEINVQTDVYLKTMSYLQPLCPAIIHADILNTNDENNREIFNIIFENSEYKSDKVEVFSIIAMEFAENYVIGGHLIKKNQNKNGKKYCYSLFCYMIIELAVKTGYAHGDFHYANFLVNEEDNTYFKNDPLSIYIIDFGMAVSMNATERKQCQEAYNNHRYNEIIDIVCEIGRGTFVSYNDKSAIVTLFFGYICDYLKTFENNDEFNMYIANWIVSKNMATHDIIRHNESKHNRELYPLLPLSNSIKNKMYRGMLDKASKSVPILYIDIVKPLGINLQNVVTLVYQIMFNSTYKRNKIKQKNNELYIQKFIQTMFSYIYLATYGKKSKIYIGLVLIYEMVDKISEINALSEHTQLITNGEWQYLKYNNLLDNKTLSEVNAMYQEIYGLLDGYIISILDFVSIDKLTLLHENELDRFKDMFKQTELYTNPKKWSDEHFK